MKKKEIKVNGKKVGVNVILKKGDTVAYYLTAKQEEMTAFSIVYEDENVLVADKADGVNSEAVFASLNREKKVYFIHRLDRNTKGLLVFAKTEKTEQSLLKAFREKKVEKIYHALCVGKLPNDQDCMTAYLQKDERQAIVKVYDDPSRGEKILTEYKVLDSTAELSKIEICLHTGKTHQIRAHFAHIGNPILGDMKYGDSAVNKRYNRTRQALVAKSLRISSKELPYLEGKTFLSSFEVELPNI